MFMDYNVLPFVGYECWIRRKSWVSSIFSEKPFSTPDLRGLPPPEGISRNGRGNDVSNFQRWMLPISRPNPTAHHYPQSWGQHRPGKGGVRRNRSAFRSPVQDLLDISNNGKDKYVISLLPVSARAELLRHSFGNTRPAVGPTELNNLNRSSEELGRSEP